MLRKTHTQYVKQLSEVNPYITVLSNYEGSLSPIAVRCLLCGNEWIAPIASELINKHNCKCKKCKSFIPKKNDDSYFSVAYPNYANWLVNKELGFRCKKKSEVKTDWKCPNCGEIVKQISFAEVVRLKHIPCKKCSDGVSFPNKVMYNLLSELKVDFCTEYSPKWISPKRYDFYIPSKNIIIEMDGSIGHGGKSYSGETNNNLLQIDIYKDNVAKQHNIDVIRIDSKKSDVEYIAKNILNSSLSIIFNLSHINWDEIEKKSFSSLQMNVIDIWNHTGKISDIILKTKLSRTTIIKYLHKGNKHGFCKYDSKNQQHLSGIKNIKKAYNAIKKPVICLDTKQVFESCRQANKWLGLNEDGHTIQDNCKGILKTAGKHPETKEKLHWMFYEDYLKEVA